MDWNISLADVVCSCLTFYSVILVWSSSKAIADILDSHKLLDEFETKVGLSNALRLLTTCLQNAFPNVTVTVEDVSVCLKTIGVNHG